MIPRDVRYAAALYRQMGWQPVPSKIDDKRPAMNSYRQFWDSPISRRQFDSNAMVEIRRKGGCNLQLMTGARWGLGVVDIDGPGAYDAWTMAFCAFRGGPPPWRVDSLGPGGDFRGCHLYYTVDPSWGPSPSRLIWGVWDADLPRKDGRKGGWAPRNQIELKLDKGLIVAPPSSHVKEACRYEIADGFDAGMPPSMPRWIFDLPAFESPREERPAAPPRLMPLHRGARLGAFDWEDVLAAIPDKIAVAAEWGIEFTGRLRGRDAHECYAFERPDSRPSAFLNARTGRYFSNSVRDGDQFRTLGFFETAVRRGAYPSFPVAVDELGRRFCQQRRSASRRDRSA